MEATASPEPVPVKETVLTDALAQELSQQASSLPDDMPVLALLGFSETDRADKQRIEKSFPEMQKSVIDSYTRQWAARERATPEWTQFLQELPTNNRTGIILSVKGLDHRGFATLADIRSKSVDELIHARGYTRLTKYIATFWKKALGPSPAEQSKTA